jgi:hypothetical protein
VTKKKISNIFIDTNYLSDMILYLDYCEAMGIDPFTKESKKFDMSE